MSPRIAAEDNRHAGATTWRFELELHAAQREVFEHPARFKVIAAGRRWGKTLLCSALCILTAASKPDANVMWVAPSHKQARMAMRMIKRALPRGSYQANNTTQEIFLSNGGRLIFVSGDRPDNLRGEGLDLVVVDEAAFIERAVWTSAIRPALADRGGRAVLISTYMGENWFWDLNRFARDPANTDWMGWELWSASNPHLPQAEIDAMRNDMSPEEFAQECECSAIAFSGAVFKGAELDAAYDRGLSLELPPKMRCEAGIDWGWNVTAMEVCVELGNGEIAWIDEAVWKRVELNARCEEIAELCKQHNIDTVYCDAAGASENVTLAQVLERSGAQTFVQPVPFAVYKKPGIQVRNFYLRKGREVLTSACYGLRVDSKAYHYDDDGEKPVKGNDHTVDAVTAFYSSRSYLLGTEIGEQE